MCCAISGNLAHLKGNGQNVLLLGRETVAGTKKVRYNCSELNIVLQRDNGVIITSSRLG